MAIDVEVTQGWLVTLPDAHAGVLLIRDVLNPATSDALQAELAMLQQAMRDRYAGADRASLAAQPTVRAYQQHYRSFGQTYHLLGQWESVALKGRPLASPGGVLVTAMFAAEIEHLLLTAAHDVDVLAPPLMLDSSVDGDRFVGISGREYVLDAGDMVMRDGDGIISAVLSGPDQRTRVTPSTSHVAYVTYAPAGIAVEDVREHLREIARLVLLAAPGASVEQLEVYPASLS
jgi:DNA/RNA-binding domain of Phe-tRNA-synthetase-like protein